MVYVAFTNPSYLWILTIVPVLVVVHFITLKQSRADVIKFANFEAIERVAKGDILGNPYKGMLRNKNLGLLLLRALIYCMLIFAAAGITILYVGRASDFDYVFAIDASSSMLADDFSPSRFEAAKQAASSFIELVPKGAKIGIVTFASTSIIELRLSDERNEVLEAMQEIELHSSGGTAIGDAVVTAANLFQANKSKMVILLTDGQGNVGLAPELAIQYARKNDIVVQTIGVATEKGGSVPFLNLTSRLDEELLRKVAKETGGNFFLAQDTAALTEAFRQIASANEKNLSVNISWIMLVIAISLLGFEWILINTMYKTIP